MKIDEAINKCRDLAYGECEPNPYYGMPYFEDKEYEQLAEWLEELKANKVTSAETYESGYKRGHREGYNKAIDDFVNNCEKKLTDMILTHQKQLDFVSGLAVAGRMLGEIAEQLKEGAVDG